MFEVLYSDTWADTIAHVCAERGISSASMVRVSSRLSSEVRLVFHDGRAQLSEVPPPAAFPLRFFWKAPETEVPRSVQSAAEYVPEIFDQLFREEAMSVVRANYMESQPDINGKMRAILVDWLVEVHMKYQLRCETLFLTVNLIDRYLAREQVVRKRLQLVGVVAMFVAAKFEEIDPPNSSQFVYITDNAYTRDDIMTLECSMLTLLGFQVVVPTAAHFLDRLKRANSCDARHGELAQYILELALLDVQMVRYEPSHLVAAALLLSNEILGRQPVWPELMVQHTRRSETILRACADDLYQHYKHAPSQTLQAVRKKFLLKEHHCVAALPIAGM